MESFWLLQSNINAFFQSLGGWLEIPMRLFTFLGEEQFFMLVMPAVYWCFNAGLGLRLGVILLVSSTLNGYLKLAFHTPRPYWVNPGVQAYVHEPSFGMPSGHSMNSASLWGRMAAAASTNWMRTFLIILIGMVGLSRIFLGVHFLTDVLTGWAAGGLLVWAFLRFEKPTAGWAKRFNPIAQTGLAFLLSALLVAVHVLILAGLQSWQLPAAWAANAARSGSEDVINPFSSAGAFSGAGTLFGLLAGVIWLRKAGGFSTAGRGWQLRARYALGLAGVVVIWFGLDQVFPDGTNLLAFSLRWLRYALTGLWISGLAPCVFKRLGLAGGEEAGPVSLPEPVS